MKSLSLILICNLLGTTLFSQELADDKSKHYVFFDKYYAKLPDKTGATYVRVFLGVDSVKKTYEVREYTMDGQLCFIANSSSKEYLRHEGPCTWFNSKQQPLKTGFYLNGLPDGVFTEYYENGRMALQTKYTKDKTYINNSWDSTGKAEVIDGNGWLIKRNDSTGTIIQTGKLRNGQADSTWTYFDKKGKKESEVVFNDGKFVTGTMYDETGKTETFKEFYANPEFPGGQIALAAFIVKTIRYPEEEMEKRVSGTVVIVFWVNKTGKISDIAVHSSVSEGLDREAQRVVRRMPDWIPGTERGKKISSWFYLPIRFALKG